MAYTKPARLEILYTVPDRQGMRWKCHVTNAGVMLENTRTGYTDWTLQYSDHSMAYDHPEQLPPYAKDLARDGWDWVHHNPLACAWYTYAFLLLHPDAQRGDI